MKRRIITIFFVILFVLPLAIPVAAVGNNADVITDETTKRVNQEILTGNITSQEDVLKVALEQYKNRAQSVAYGSRSANDPAIDDSSPRITQVLESSTDEDGYVTYLIADTGLLVLDAAGEEVSTSRLYTTTYDSFDEYNISAQHTVYFYYKLPLTGLGTVEDQVKIYSMSTILQYNGSYQATKLEQYYCVDVNGLPTQSLQKSVAYPASNTKYTSYPSGVNWEYAYDFPYPGFSTSVFIYYGSDSYEIVLDINSVNGMNYTGTW